MPRRRWTPASRAAAATRSFCWTGTHTSAGSPRPRSTAARASRRCRGTGTTWTPGSAAPKWRRANASMPSWLDSSAPVDSRITRTPSGGGASRSRRATSSRTATPLRLSLAPGTTGWRIMWAMTTAVAAATRGPERRRATATGERAHRDRRRAADHQPHQRRPAVGPRHHARQLLHHELRERLIEDERRARRVVVGVDHQRVARVLRAELGDHVGGRPALEHAPQRAAPAAGEVLPDPGGAPRPRPARPGRAGPPAPRGRPPRRARSGRRAA